MARIEADHDALHTLVDQMRLRKTGWAANYEAIK